MSLNNNGSNSSFSSLLSTLLSKTGFACSYRNYKKYEKKIKKSVQQIPSWVWLWWISSTTNNPFSFLLTTSSASLSQSPTSSSSLQQYHYHQNNAMTVSNSSSYHLRQIFFGATFLALFSFWLQSDDDDDDDADDKNNGNNIKPHTTTTKPRDFEHTDSGVSLLSSSTTATNNNNNNSTEKKEKKQKKQHVEILLHNVSHTDLVLGLDVIEDNDNNQNKSDNRSRSSSISNYDYHPKALCTPRFSGFDMYCRRVLESLEVTTPTEKKASSFSNSNKAQQNQYKQVKKSSIIDFPRYERSFTSPRLSINPLPSSDMAPIPTGIRLNDTSSSNNDNNNLIIQQQECTDLRIRGRDIKEIEPYLTKSSSNNKNSNVYLSSVFFPLIATLLPRWEDVLYEKHQHNDTNTTDNIMKVLILVTGVGTPRNWTHSINGNSTELLANLIELFINTIDPSIIVIKIHSETNIFRYDENLLFVQHELMPIVHSYRDSHATSSLYPHEIQKQLELEQDKNEKQQQYKIQKQPFNVNWRETFNVSLSFADGSAARTNAIQASLREYRPTYFHFWQLKTFWHDTKIVDDDIEVHSFEFIETVPAIDVDEIINVTDNANSGNENIVDNKSSIATIGEGIYQKNNNDYYLKLVIDEMIAFKKEILETLINKPNDIKTFWLRKTHKPVLAVLLVMDDDNTNDSNHQMATKKPKLYRGTNMEVSMPTGSLCAERNVIGTALASNPSLKREHLKIVAVLAVPLPTKESSNYCTTIQTDSNITNYNSHAVTNDIIVSASNGSNNKLIHTTTAIVAQKKSETSEVVVVAGGGMKRSTSSTGLSNNRDHDDWILQSSSLTESLEIIPSKSSPTSEVIVVDDNMDNNDTLSPMKNSSKYRNNSTPEIESSRSALRRISLFYNTRKRSASLGAIDDNNYNKNDSSNNSSKLNIRNNQTAGTAAAPTNDNDSINNSGILIQRSNSSDRLDMNVINRRLKKTVLVHSAKDINPLKPCGACNEWLKKIAECNPYFKIITFTDADCNGIYVQRCQEY